jgi:hypothetical protein
MTTITSHLFSHLVGIPILGGMNHELETPEPLRRRSETTAYRGAGWIAKKAEVARKKEVEDLVQDGSPVARVESRVRHGRRDGETLVHRDPSLFVCDATSGQQGMRMDRSIQLTANSVASGPHSVPDASSS